MKKLKNFRLSEEACQILEMRAQAKRVSQAWLIEDWLLGSRPEVVGVDPASGEDHSMVVRGEMKDGVLKVDSIETEKAERDEFLGGDQWTPEEQAKMDKVAPQPVNKILTREEREAKIDAFQRKMAKGKK